jgi:hypothetical protein
MAINTLLVQEVTPWSRVLPASFRGGGHAVRRVGARQLMDVTPGRPFVMLGVRRTVAVKGLPRSRWLPALGIHDSLGT